MSSSIRCRVCRVHLGGALLALGWMLTGCSSVTESTRSMAQAVTPYKIEIVQGNFVSKEQTQALKPGMSRIQVREILGTSLLASVFHADRWDYVFTLKRQGVAPQERRLTVYFKEDVLERVVGGEDMPSETEFVTSLKGSRKTAPVPVLEATPEMLEKYAKPKSADGSGASASQEATPTQVSAPVAYPPLEAPVPATATTTP